MYPIALMCLSPLSAPFPAASFPHVLLSSGPPPVPNPILESQVTQSFSLFPGTTNSRCSDGVCGIAVAPFGVESLLVTVRL